MGQTLAYMLTWTTYGTWMHGDKRGSVDRNNACHGMEYLLPDPRREDACQKLMKSPPVVLLPEQRQIIEQAIERHCAIRDWMLIAVNCRSNHIHVLVSTDGTLPERVMSELKAYATRALRQNRWNSEGKVWTRGGSTRYIKSPVSLESAKQYVLFQ